MQYNKTPPKGAFQRLWISL